MSMYKDTAALYDKIFKFNPSVVNLIEEYLPAQGSDILDIGCGTGKYSGKLSELHRVVGIDTDARSIEVAREKYPDAEFINSDLLSYQPGRNFDLIFCIGNVISHIKKSEIRLFVERVRSNLKERGIWLFHTMNWDMIIKMNEFDFPIIENEGVRFVRMYRNISGDRVDFITILSDTSGGEIKNCITLYPQTAAEVDELHRGFEHLAVFKNYDKEPFESGDISKVYIYRKVTNVQMSDVQMGLDNSVDN
jgi:glycine/sarcosine N-methyltransferase